ncbi:hypothetical protein D9M68_914220 [compost metagenome]
MIEEQVQQNPGIAPPLGGEARTGLGQQRVAVGKGIDAPMQDDRGFDIRRPLPGQPDLDEIAVQAAEQLGRRVATEVQMSEVVHRPELTHQRGQ